MGLLDQLSLVEHSAGDSADETAEGLAPDPVPDTKPPTRARKKPGPKPGSRRTPPAGRAKSTATMAKEVAEDLTSLLEMSAAAWSMRDECCAPVLAEQAKPIAVAFTGILERNPRLLARFAMAENAGLIIQALALVKALAPVGRAIVQNHGPGALRAAEGIPGVDAPPPPNPLVDVEQFPVFSGVPRAHPA